MTTQMLMNSSLQFAHASFIHRYPGNATQVQSLCGLTPIFDSLKSGTRNSNFTIRCAAEPTQSLRTCKNCKTQFDVSLNHPRACRFHTAHFGGETKRKFESVYSGGTMSTPDAGKVFLYWHCCGSEDPFDPGCTAAPHYSYDD